MMRRPPKHSPTLYPVELELEKTSPFFNPESSSSVDCLPICQCHLRLARVFQCQLASQPIQTLTCRKRGTLDSFFSPLTKRHRDFATSLATPPLPTPSNMFAAHPSPSYLPPDASMEPFPSPTTEPACSLAPRSTGISHHHAADANLGVTGTATIDAEHPMRSHPQTQGGPGCVPQRSQTHPSKVPTCPIPLSFGTINTGGAMSPERFRQMLDSLPSLLTTVPLFIALVEFRPQGHPLRVALEHGYHLLFDAPESKGGVGLLLSSQVLPMSPPPVCAHSGTTD